MTSAGTFTFKDLKKVAEAEGMSFELVAEGDHEVEVQKGAQATKSSNGKDMIKLVFVVVEGPQAKKGKVWHNIVLTVDNPTALGFFFQDLKRLGLGDEYFAHDPEPSFKQIAADLVGRRCIINVFHDPYNGEDRAKVKRIKPSKTAQQEPLTAPGTGGAGTAKPSGVPTTNGGAPTVGAVPNVQQGPANGVPGVPRVSAHQAVNGDTDDAPAPPPASPEDDPF